MEDKVLDGIRERPAAHCCDCPGKWLDESDPGRAEFPAHSRTVSCPVVRQPTATRRTAKLPIVGSDRAERDLAWRPESDSERAAV